ncbi:PKD domain-containing protein [Aliiroseovarius sp. CAU 1755]
MARSILSAAFIVFISLVGTVFAQTPLQPRTADVGEAIRLDPTDGLRIPLADSVHFEWSWLERPATSVVNFSDPIALRPEVTIDVAGRYVAQVIVRNASDPTIEVATGSLEINTGDTAPVAAIIARGLPEGSSPLVLDGSRSIDLDGGPLNYSWSVISAPTGSDARITSADLPMAKLRMDLEGTYVAGLTVTDEVGQASELAKFEVDFLPNSGSVDSYRLSYDETHSGVDNVVDSFDLGDRSAGNFGNSQITGFELGSDVLSLTLAGMPVTASTTAELYALVDILELDSDDATNVRMSPNVDVDEVTFIFGGTAGAVTITDIIGAELLRTELDARGADVYEGVGGRQVGPEASARFDQLSAEVGEIIRLEPYASTDIDGSVLVSEIAVLAAPSGASPSISTDIDGMSELNFDVAGEYLVSYRVSDGLRNSFDQVLVVVGQGANVRPVARIQPVTTAQVGTPLELDGTQSYDLDGDLIRHGWSLLYVPAGSAATVAEGSSATASFTPDVEGDYVVQLEVHDATAPGAPTTQLVRVAPALPIAEAGPDRLAGDVGHITLDGTLSSGADLTYGWASLGLTGDGSASGISDASLAMPQLSLAVREGRFRDVIKLASVYHFKRSDAGGLCQFDTRTPADVVESSSSEQISITLHSRGQTTASGSKLLVWEIENKNQYTREVRLEDQDGNDHGSFVVPGRVSVHVTTADIGKNNQMYAFVGSAAYADDRPKTNPFNRNNPVCTGPGAGVVQLIVKDSAGLSLPDTAFVGNTNLRPVLLSGPKLDLISGQTVELSGAAYGSDPNGDALSYSWSLISRPDGSSATITADPATKKFAGSDLTFAPDRVGVYLVQVEASDGQLNAVPAVVRIEVLNSPPVAVATGPANVFVGETGIFDGTASSDIDGDALTYLWTLTDRPDASTFEIADRFAPTVTFSPDRRGDYVFELVVSDYEFSSDPVTVTVTAPNRAPAAGLSGPSEIDAAEEVIFSAMGSTDPDSDPLTYAFELTSQPAGSSPLLAQTGDGDATFSAAVSGPYTLEVTVSDGLLSDVAVIEFEVRSRNQAPVLGSINDVYTVELGLEFALDLQGSDPDGDAISFYATPLPLAEGIWVNAADGTIRFRPEAGQLGSYSFTVGVSDGVLVDEAVLTIDVVDATAGDTAIHGRVLDAEQFAQGVEVPLSGMQVRLRDAALMTVTDVSGEFSFGSLAGGSDQIVIDPFADGGPGGYQGAVRAVQVTENQIRDLDPDFLLAPLNDGCAPVVAGVVTVLEGAASGVSVTIPADSIEDMAGGTFTGEVCLGSLPQLFADTGLPQDTRACNIYALNAPGAVFTQGITVSAPNNDLLPEGATLDLWRKSMTTGQYARSSGAHVDAGGMTVSASAQGFSEGTLFSLLPLQPSTTASADQPTGNSTLSALTGDMNQVYTLPGYTAFGQAQTVGFSYHSQSANPTIVVSGDVTVSENASLPETLSTRISVGGLSVDDTNAWTPRLGADGHIPALLGETVSLRQSMPVDGSGLDSGRYNYDFVAKANYACSTVASSHSATLHVQNEAASPYGNGWSVDGLQKLVEGPDGTVSIFDDDGVSTFEPGPTLTKFLDEGVVLPAIGPAGIEVYDYNQNGRPEIAWADTGTGDIVFAERAIDGSFGISRRVAVADPASVPETGPFVPNLSDLALGDFNGDGDQDLAYALYSGKAVRYLSDFTAANPDTISVHDPSRQLVTSLEAADFDGDGYDDLVTAEISTVFIGYFWQAYADLWRGSANGLDANEVLLRDTYLTLAAPQQASQGDINGDGLPDIFFRMPRGWHVFTMKSPRKQKWGGGGGHYALGQNMAVGDLNDDGLDDFVNNTPANLAVHFNQTDGVDGEILFGGTVYLPRPAVPDVEKAATNVVDANGDGFDDVVISVGGKIYVYHSNGDGTFQPISEVDLGHGLGSVRIADMNGDRSPDLISTTRFFVYIDFSDPSASGTYIAGLGDFTQLEQLPDGTWERRYKDGTKILFDQNGLQVAEIDPQGNRKEYGYDANSRLVTITDQVGGVTTFAYAADGRMASVTYPDGRTTLFEHDDIGNLSGITEPTGTQVSFSYDENGRLVSSTNQNGNTTSYSYDAVGNLSGAVLPDSSSISTQIASSLGLIDGLGNVPAQPFIYVKPEDRVTTVTDRKGQVTTVEVNQFGSVIRTVDPLGRETRIHRNEENLVTRVERPSDVLPDGVRVDEIEYDFLDNVAAFTEALGSPVERTTRYTYDRDHSKVTQMTDPDGQKTLYEYDATGLTTKITDAEGGTRSFNYDADGKLASRTDENGNLTSFTHDAQRNLETTTYADGSITALTYDAAGNTVVIAEAQGTPIERQVQRSYDALNRVLTVEVTGADGAQIDGVTTYSYLPAGNLASVVDETGLVTTMTYDQMERLVAVDDPAEGLIQRVYNTAGEIVSHINGDGEAHSYAYDEVGRLTDTVDPGGFEKHFAYNLQNSISTVTDGRDGVTSFGYDALERMTTRTNPIGETMTRSYDARGNLLTLTREDGVVETASYDGLSRRTSVVTPDNVLSYRYDARGNLIKAADTDSRVAFTYDLRNRLLTTTTDGAVGVQPQVTLSYSYDALDRRTTMADSLGGTTSYAYDPEDRLTDLTAPWGTVYSFDYDGEGRRTSLTSTSGRVSQYGNTNGLLTALSHVQSGVALTDLEYQYGPDGQLTAILDKINSLKSKFISYDDLNRLVQVDEGLPPIDGGVPVPVEDYAYDEEGNRTASHLSALYSSNAHNQLEEDEDYSYAYDQRGNRVSKTSKANGDVETYAYDSQNRLVGYANATLSARYAYDALDRRIAKIIDGPGEDITPPGQAEPYALNLTAQDDVDIPDLEITGPFTVEAWVRFPSGSSIHYDDSLVSDGTVEQTLNFYQNRFRFYSERADRLVASTASSHDVWTHYAITRDTSGILRIYIDGVLDVAGTAPYTYPLKIGTIGRPTNRTIGQFDDIRIWSVARNESQIAAARGAYMDPATRGLERLYRFDESLTEVVDATGTSAPSALGAGVTIVPSTAPVASLPAAPAAPGPNAEVTAYVYDISAEDPLAHDDIVLEYSDDILTRRWLHSNAVDEPVGFEEYVNTSGVGSGQERSMFADRQGSVIWVTEPATGTALAAYEYDGYGQITQTQGTLSQPYGYTGREYDAESRLYHYRARAYDPEAGVFTQADPIGFGARSLNLHQYVLNNPFRFNDPSGNTTADATLTTAAAGSSGGAAVTTVGIGIAQGPFQSIMAMLRTASGLLALERSVSLVKFPEGPHGDCNKGDMKRYSTQMKKEYRRIESQKLSCDQLGTSASDIVSRQLRATELGRAIYLRELHAAVCFRGGDRGHRERIENLSKAREACLDF